MFVFVLVRVCVNRPETRDTFKKRELLAGIFKGFSIILIQPPLFVATDCPEKMSVQLAGKVMSLSMLSAVDILHTTSALTSAVAFEETTCAHAVFAVIAVPASKANKSFFRF